MSDQVFADAMAQIFRSLLKELQEKKPEDINQWAIEKIMEIKSCDRESAEKIFQEILEGIKAYREADDAEEIFDKNLEKASLEEQKQVQETLDAIADSLINEIEEGKDGQKP